METNDKLSILQYRMQVIINEINCRIEHGAEGKEHLAFVEKVLTQALHESEKEDSR